MGKVIKFFLLGLSVFILAFSLRLILFPPEIKHKAKIVIVTPEGIHEYETDLVEPDFVNECKEQFKEHSIQYYICIIDSIDIDKAIEDVCKYKPQLCPILKDRQIYMYLKKYYKPSLLTIADVEGKFVIKRGWYDKNDISVFQINIRYFPIEEMNKLTGDRFHITSIEDVMHNEYIAGEVALRVWLVNIATYIITTGRFPKNLPEYISLYHAPAEIRKYYKKKVNRVVWKYIRKFEQM